MMEYIVGLVAGIAVGIVIMVLYSAISIGSEADERALSRYAMRVCECPYHTKLRDDDEADRREQAEMEGEYGGK